MKFKKMLLVILLLIGLLMPSPVLAETRYLLDPGPTCNSLHLLHESTGLAYYEAGFGSGSLWHIAQWNEIGYRLQAVTEGTINNWFVRNSQASSDGTTSAKVNVYLYGGERIYDLYLNTRGSPIEGTEYDLLLEPNHYWHNQTSGLPIGVLPLSSQPPLASITHLLARGNFRLIRGPSTQHPMWAATIMAIAFVNVVTEHVFFYQMTLYDSRLPQTFQGYFDCPGSTPGYDDYVNITYGQPYLTPGGGWIYYNLDIANRVKELIQTNPCGIDTNLNNWKVAGPYYGIGMGGETVMQVRMKNIDLSYE